MTARPEIFHEAISVIKKRGLGRGALVDYQNRVCMLGAVGAATGIPLDVMYTAAGDDAYDMIKSNALEELRVLAGVIRDDGPVEDTHLLSTVFGFSDGNFDTFLALDTLRRAAEVASGQTA